MAKRPVFIPLLKAPFYDTVWIEFVYNPGFAPSQKRKNIEAIHKGFEARYGKTPLEISSKSLQDGGVELSAFNLKTYVKSIDAMVPVECAYQGGKVFKNGGPYTDLFQVHPRVAKRDERLRNSGELVGFKFEGQEFPLAPQSLYYDYLWINALLDNPELVKTVLQFEGFTDIEFSPSKSISCQAKAAAVFVALHKLGKLDMVRKVDTFFELITGKVLVDESLPISQVSAVVGRTEMVEAMMEKVEKSAEMVSVLTDAVIEHPKFGKGIVIKDNQGILEIEFKELGLVKKLGKDWVLAHCKC